MRYTIEDILSDLDAAIEREGVRGYARRVHLSATFVSLVARRKAPPGPRIIADLGYEDDGKRYVRRSNMIRRSDAKIDGKPYGGKVVAGEFVGVDDEEGRPPGTYITIRLNDPGAGLVAGQVEVTYLPLDKEIDLPK